MQDYLSDVKLIIFGYILYEILQYTVMQDYLSDVKLIIFHYFYVFYTNCELFQLLQKQINNPA
jgi:hypothetical protein